MKKFTFFLGGYDAEMCEIRIILEQSNCQFYDKQLAWGAKLSSYEQELKQVKDSIPVLIELNIDITYPPNSVILDHHGERAGKDKPTSIEQLAKLLRLELSYWQKLIAANDRGWIDELVEIGATKKEIQLIRQYDRRCQGVTDKEEKAAEKAITKLKYEENLAVIDYQLEHTSPIIDRLYGQYPNILIFTPKTTEFYGNGSVIQELAKQFQECWYGGQLPEKGYWGISFKNLIVQEVITKTLKEV